MKGNWREAAYEERGLLGLTAALLAAILLLNPVGFQGGGLDDWQYVMAARCWIENGPCLPLDHWQGRWPVIAPLAASMAIFGENRLGAGLPILLASLATLVLLWGLVWRLSSARIAALVTLFLAASPFFAVRLLQPSVEAIELAILLGCAHAILNYRDGKGTIWAGAAGLLFALAIQVRETSVIALPLLLLVAWHWARHDWKALGLAALGAAIPTAIELLVFVIETGNPFYRRTLSVGHTQILSSELMADPDRDRSPFFNIHYIANWRHEPGIALHWSIDGIVNLFFNAISGISLLVNLILLPILWRGLPDRAKRVIKVAIALAAYWAAMIVYVFAIDPNPRMLVVPILASHFVLATLLTDLARRGMKLVVALIIALTALVGLALSNSFPGHQDAKEGLEAIMARHAGEIEADYNTRKQVTLLEGASQLETIFDDRPFLLIQLFEECEPWARKAFGSRLALVERHSMNDLRSALDLDVGYYCLFSYEGEVAPQEVIVARFPEILEETAERDDKAADR